jgi:TM2 domain-containing membrane protein YozV
VITLVIAFFQFGVAALVLGIPLFLMAHRKGRPEVLRKFFVGAAGIGLFCGLVAAGSERLLNQCDAAGNPTCIDYGGAGFQVFALIGYALVAFGSALYLRQEPDAVNR